MVISIKNFTIKINTSLDFYIDSSKSNIEILALVQEDFYNNFRRLRLKTYNYTLLNGTNNDNFSYVLSLLNPVLNRQIGRYYVKVKRIIYIKAKLLENNNKLTNQLDEKIIDKFPNLRLISKCIIDDGTYEACIFIYNNDVINFFDIEGFNLKNKLEAIYEYVKINNEYNIYHIKSDNITEKAEITVYFSEFILSSTYIMYCLPFSKLVSSLIYLFILINTYL